MPILAPASSRSWCPCPLVNEERVNYLNTAPLCCSIHRISLVGLFLLTVSAASSSRTSSLRVPSAPDESYVAKAPNASPHPRRGLHSVVPRMVNLIYGASNVRCFLPVNLPIPLPALRSASSLIMDLALRAVKVTYHSMRKCIRLWLNRFKSSVSINGVSVSISSCVTSFTGPLFYICPLKHNNVHS